MTFSFSSIAPFISQTKSDLPRQTDGKAFSPTLMNLPPEIWRKILHDDGFGAKDILALRCASQKFKAIVDDVILRQFRVPSSISGRGVVRPRLPAKLPDYLRARKHAHLRAVNGQYREIEFVVGKASFALSSDSENMFVVCGNGRVLKANLFSPTGLFTQLAPLGTVSSAEYLLAATCSVQSPNLWRLITVSRDDFTRRYLYAGTESGHVRIPLQRLSTMPEVPPDHQYLDHQLTFSSNRDYLVERSYYQSRRFFLGDSPNSVRCEAAIPSEKTMALCPQTGRRFVLRMNNWQLPTVRIFADAWSSRVEQEVTLAHRLSEPYGLSVSPDGWSFGLMIHRRKNHGVTGFTDVLNLYTYDIAEDAAQYLSPVFQETSERFCSFDEIIFTPEVHWADHPTEGWQFESRQSVGTRHINHNPCDFYGIEDSSRMAVLFMSIGRPTSLVWMSSLPQDANATLFPAPSRSRWLRYQLDQAISYPVLQGGPSIIPNIIVLYLVTKMTLEFLVLSEVVKEADVHTYLCLYVGMALSFCVLIVAAELRYTYLATLARRYHAGRKYSRVNLQTAFLVSARGDPLAGLNASGRSKKRLLRGARRTRPL